MLEYAIVACRTCPARIYVYINVHVYLHIRPYIQIYFQLFVYAASYTHKRTLILMSVVNYANNSAGNVSGCERPSIHRLGNGSVRPGASRGRNGGTKEEENDA